MTPAIQQASAMLSWEAWFTIAVLLAMVIALVKNFARTDYILLGSLGLLLLVGIVTPEEAFAGFSNTAVLTVAALFVVAEAVHRTNALSLVDRLLFSKSPTPSRSLPGLMSGTAVLSGFLNNTPVVAMLIPRVQSWSNKIGIPSSKVLIPLSYAAILGGLITLIGTSTNIVISGLLEAEGYEPLRMFDLTWIGIPAAIVVILFFVLGGHKLLPDGDTKNNTESTSRDYVFELRVPEGSKLAGMTVEDAGLRDLGNAFLVHRVREGRVQSIGRTNFVSEGDILAFSGNIAAADQLLEQHGLEPIVDRFPESEQTVLPLFEAVVAPSSRMIGRTLKEVGFRELFGGVVLAIKRRDEKLASALGSVRIRTGDLLLIEAPPGFAARWNASRDEFYIVTRMRDLVERPRSNRAPIVLAILFGMVAIAAAGWLPLVTTAFSAALAVIVFRCIRGREAQQAVDVKVLVVIAAALGIGKAVEQTGLSDLLGNGLVDLLLPLGTIAVMIGLYACTNILTELITHKAAAVLMLPVALAAAAKVGVDPKAFALVVAVGAAASFMTPIGYQTNLMVMSSGGYRFSDYLRVGIPVSILVMTVAVTMIYQVWIV